MFTIGQGSVFGIITKELELPQIFVLLEGIG
jgi:hypothetical protein